MAAGLFFRKYGPAAVVDNSLSPHGGVLIERVALPEDAGRAALAALPRWPLRDQLARECVNLAYGFFSPLDGFMGRADLDSVARRMTLASGYVWSIPILLDLPPAEVARLELQPGKSVLLTYQEQPLAILEVTEIYSYDKEFLARQVYGTADAAHPGVQRTYAYQDCFVAGPITLINHRRSTRPLPRSGRRSGSCGKLWRNGIGSG